MKNLLNEVALARRASDATLTERLADASPDTQAVLSAPLRRTHYERVHLQYEAIAAAQGLLELAGTRDGHRWAERCAEFGSAVLPGHRDVLDTE